MIIRIARELVIWVFFHRSKKSQIILQITIPDIFFSPIKFSYEHNTYLHSYLFVLVNYYKYYKYSDRISLLIISINYTFTTTETAKTLVKKSVEFSRSFIHL